MHTIQQRTLGPQSPPRLKLCAVHNPRLWPTPSALVSVSTKPGLLSPRRPKSVTKQTCPDLIATISAVTVRLGQPPSLSGSFLHLPTLRRVAPDQSGPQSAGHQRPAAARARGTGALWVIHRVSLARESHTDSKHSCSKQMLMAASFELPESPFELPGLPFELPLPSNTAGVCYPRPPRAGPAQKALPLSGQRLPAAHSGSGSHLEQSVHTQA